MKTYIIKSTNPNLHKISTDVINNTYKDALVFIGVATIAAFMYLINSRLLPYMVSSIKFVKPFNFKGLSILIGSLLETLHKYNAYKIVIVIFHGFDKNGNPTKYTITNQVGFNDNVILPKHEVIKDVPFSFILPEVEHMRANGGDHYCNVTDNHVSERFRRFMIRYGIKSHYAYLMHDLQGNEVGCIYVDMDKEADDGIYSTNVRKLSQALESKITSHL